MAKKVKVDTKKVEELKDKKFKALRDKKVIKK